MKTIKVFSACKKHIKIWWKMTMVTSQVAFASRVGAILFIVGKLLRFGFFLLFLTTVVSKTKTLGGYDLWQVIFFFATFNIIDVIPQFLFREVYRFRSQVVAGTFDFTLIKPISPLFRALLGGSDIFDLSIFGVSVVFLIIAGSHISGITAVSVFWYVALIANACLIALAFHIFVLALGVLTTEVDNAIMVYRDIIQVGRFPIDIYKQPMRGIFTFLLPVGIMMSFPPQALMGLLSFSGFLMAIGVAVASILAALQFWSFSLKKYSSASS